MRPLAALRSRLSTPLDFATADPIVVLGNQKTGSSAIAGLLAARTGVSLAADLEDAWTREFELAQNRAMLDLFIQKNRYTFRHAIVKENSLTLAADGLFDTMPKARGVFVVRHPVDNIRSILDRLTWPGDPRPVESLKEAPATWQQVFNLGLWGVDVADHISALAHRWRLTTEAVLRNRPRGFVVRYEDFDHNKLGTIDLLATDLALNDREPIDHLLDHAFQPRGSRRNDSVHTVFSDETLNAIVQICSEGMRTLGYDSTQNSA